MTCQDYNLCQGPSLNRCIENFFTNPALQCQFFLLVNLKQCVPLINFRSAERGHMWIIAHRMSVVLEYTEEITFINVDVIVGGNMTSY